MSRMYKVEIEVNPVYEENEDTAQKLLEKWGLECDGRREVATYTWSYSGLVHLGGGEEPSQAQARLADQLNECGTGLCEMEVKVVTRWRCLDQDQWDESYDSMEDE